MKERYGYPEKTSLNMQQEEWKRQNNKIVDTKSKRRKNIKKQKPPDAKNARYINSASVYPHIPHFQTQSTTARR